MTLTRFPIGSVEDLTFAAFDANQHPASCDGKRFWVFGADKMFGSMWSVGRLPLFVVAAAPAA